MLELPVTGREIYEAARSLSHGWKARNGDGDFYQRLTGAAAQFTLHRALDLPLPEFGGGSDGGSDFVCGRVLRVDLKTVGRFHAVLADHACPVPAAQRENRCDLYLFASLWWGKLLLQVCGAMMKTQFSREARFAPKGARFVLTNGSSWVWEYDADWVYVRELHPVHDLRHLKIGLDRAAERLKREEG